MRQELVSHCSRKQKCFVGSPQSNDVCHIGFPATMKLGHAPDSALHRRTTPAWPCFIGPEEVPNQKNKCLGIAYPYVGQARSCQRCRFCPFSWFSAPCCDALPQPTDEARTRLFGMAAMASRAASARGDSVQRFLSQFQRLRHPSILISDRLIACRSGPEHGASTAPCTPRAGTPKSTTSSSRADRPLIRANAGETHARPVARCATVSTMPRTLTRCRLRRSPTAPQLWLRAETNKIPRSLDLETAVHPASPPCPALPLHH